MGFNDNAARTEMKAARAAQDALQHKEEAAMRADGKKSYEPSPEYLAANARTTRAAENVSLWRRR